MKRLLIVLIASSIMIPALGSFALAADADAVLGTWVVGSGKAAVQIYKCGAKYCGKIVWLKEPKNPDGTEKLDKNNPDQAKRSRKLMGLNLVWGFKHDGNKWVDGGIYDPDKGKTYSCKMTLEGNNKLKVRGFIGISAIGRTDIWTKR